MNAVATMALERAIRFKNQVRGIGFHRHPERHFGPGGVEEAEALCAEANRDLTAFLRPPAAIEATSWRSAGRAVADITLDSPLPSGRPHNDLVHVRLHRPAATSPGGPVLVFHHPVYQRRWGLWEWLFADLIRQVPVAFVASPYHFQRTPPGEYPGEGTVNPNPWRMFEAMRQWAWDQRAVTDGLRRHEGLVPAATIGFSLGAFQSLLAATGGFLDGPVVALACTNRYTWGLNRGILGRGIVDGMRRVGIDEARLQKMAESVELERHVAGLKDRPVLMIAGRHDEVDPQPSAERLMHALRPARAVVLDAGHGSLVVYRRRIVTEIRSFLGGLGVL